ncbi:accessory gene regulator B family protein [Paenibacillus sp. GCM10012307]|uniref:Accessory gene regulator B family protein n=1 Tax=Paenibacillus roseus TaxID=2798579 RepID=A0A934JBV4_9BACL|nr:accessory gene regulator B family protein [Paenibacillus roseus]MBJ6364207.1 accessory gene regulator B family protein [Paenibacillus roseus]
MLYKYADGLRQRIEDSGVTAPSTAVTYYALQIIVNTVTIAGCALLIGFITGEFWRAALAIVSFGVIRYLSGGYHLKAGYLCIIVSTLLLSILPHLSFPIVVIKIMTIISVISFALFAPSNYDKYARMPKRYYPLLKIVSTGLVASNFVILSDVLAMTYIIQAVLLPLGKERRKT